MREEQSTLPVISVSPENATQSIGNVLEDRDAGEEVVIVYERQTERFTIVGHETVAQTNRKEANPYLNITKFLKVVLIITPH